MTKGLLHRIAEALKFKVFGGFYSYDKRDAT